MMKDTKETITTDPIFEHYMKELEERIDLFDNYVEWWMMYDFESSELTPNEVYGRLRTVRKISEQTIFINEILQSMDDHLHVKEVMCV